MANIYDINRYGKAVFLVVSVIVVALFVYFSNGLIEDLSQQERERMQIWADATKEIIDTSNAAIGNWQGEKRCSTPYFQPAAFGLQRCRYYFLRPFRSPLKSKDERIEILQLI